ncbi:ribosome biogenesis GTPase Der [Alteromonas macleodii]|jgi:GTP-binding protein|uniref:ribosome biogenesis GTPase Der n=1 Tax=Alteromonas TaxID=226 RepID=UPI0000289948|nr:MULTISPECIES: ribosome biogenesis GTPase Der [Alteromonas]MEC7080933.1 ribosome biogenesis GTPase Der [Pseudomonadota bacterium]NKX31729.1 ribosome biogenesis GTPase Der [Alteromonadaceae bacterium A_SAG1]AFT96132.1 GTP-binding protein Der [Alteromonas macleodii str. 'Balearic Sea AD45']AUI83218.1 ribosome biogenesis GTPase Der [Alteromonas macleodii]KHT60378.1 GTP-binding protein Der [Alteromonas macleodii]|tara:strand:- start:350 stop:1795 length:1446 start_codon:yes stop_codon:yes gene_type:complete
MLPVVALVGRPNVGKSTLFNRLTNTRDALVADYPGLTRDRKYGQAKFEKRQFIVVDTGGITGDEEGIDAEMAQQSLLAIEEADVVLFLVDARAGMLPADQGIADHLRRINKKVFVVANKVDGIDGDSESAEFYSLGLGDIKQIAAAHGRGVSQLLQDALKPLESDFPDMEIVDEEPEEEEDAETQRQRLQELPIKLAIVGKPNVGKSTLTNRILGEERVVVFDMPGTTRDSVYIPMERDEREYILIDTAGVRKRKKISEAVEKFSIVKTLQAIEEANVVLLVIDAREGITDQDLSLLGFVLNSGRSLVVAVNKWDGLSTDVKDDIKREMDRRLGFIDFARIHFISALHGSGVGNLFESVQEAYMSATKRINTALLTQIMEMAQDDHQPPLVRGRRVKMKYAHAGGYNPPVIVIHGNQVDDLPSSYKRFLMNYFRKALEIMGTPIKIEFREGNNPFEGKKANLTLAQQRKRRRMMSYYKDKK